LRMFLLAKGTVSRGGKLGCENLIDTILRSAYIEIP
jgi:hypothetical protein